MNLNFHAIKESGNMMLPDLVTQIEKQEFNDLPDRIINLSDLKMNDDLNIVVPDQGNYALTPWSRRQIANLLGIRFDRWFENADNDEKAFEMNRRFQRAERQIKIRTTALSYDSNKADGILKAFVSPSYVPISDSFVGNLMISNLGKYADSLPIIRAHTTDKTLSYFVKFGKVSTPGIGDAVGDIFGGILVQNSGVGYSSFSISLSLIRLVCSNGMTAPVAGAIMLRRKHVGDPEMALWEKIATVIESAPEKLADAINVLRLAQNIAISEPQRALESVIKQAGLPRKLVATFQQTYQKEPLQTAFGISQALTDAATHQELGLSPEETRQIEDVAGKYLRDQILM